jgi:hypothetical protein
MSRVGSFWLSRSIASNDLPVFTTDGAAEGSLLQLDAFLAVRENPNDLYHLIAYLLDLVIDILTRWRDYYSDLSRRQPRPVVPTPAPLPDPTDLGPFVCKVRVPGWIARRAPGAQSTWCRACGVACAAACIDDLDTDCFTKCGQRQIKCMSGGGFTF